ncbi:MAG: serine/threonine protein kinase [Candidatus Riflebacteria bacterium]|nr:serine/threonine protein kinase [Candidatus Riflebacteria bacterium]
MDDRLGPYLILELLGEGGMGSVFRARHLPLDRQVALKVLHPNAALDLGALRRFRREMRVAADLCHPNLVKVLDGGDVEGTPYIAMELVEGTTLQSVIRRSAPLPWAVALSIGSCIADGLVHLHDREILHRDIKPSNILISRGCDVKLADFGLARVVSSTVLTEDGSILGTVQFLAPEVLVGDRATPASDLWAVGCVLYLMLTARMHVQATSVAGWSRAILNDPIPAPAQIVRRVPAPVSQLVLSLVARRPEDRPSSALELKKGIDELLARMGRTSWELVLTPGTLDRVVPVDEPRHRPEGDQAPESPPTPILPPVSPAAAAHGAAIPGEGPSRVRRGAVAAIGAVAGVILVVSALWPGGQGPAQPGLPVAPVPVGATAPPSAADRPCPISSSVFHRWCLFTGYLPRLRAGGRLAREAVDELHRKAPFDLGTARDGWIFWLELGRWMASSHRSPDPPVMPNAQEGPLPMLEELLAFGYLDKLDKLDSAQRVSSALLRTGQRPDDGRCWLALGFVLEMERCDPEALEAYRLALDRLSGTSLENARRYLWTGLIRALMTVQGRSLEKEWGRWACQVPGLARPWETLGNVLQDAQPERYERLLRDGVGRPDCSEQAWTFLGTFLQQVRKDDVGARDAWVEGLKRNPGSVRLMECLVEHNLTRGLVAECAGYLEVLPQVHWTRVAIAHLTEPLEPICKHPPVKFPTHGHGRSLLMREVYRLLDTGAARDALARIEALTASRSWVETTWPTVALDLLALGVDRPDVVDRCRQLLLGPPLQPAAWVAAAGSLRTPGGAPWMSRWLAEAALRSPEAWAPHLGRALWLSRQRRCAESLAALARARQRALPEGAYAGEVCEIMSRPLWILATGGSVEPGCERVVRSAPGPRHDPRVVELWTHLEAGRLDRALDTARAGHDAQPRREIWGRSLVWLTRARGDPDGARLWIRRLRAGLRFRMESLGFDRDLALMERELETPSTVRRTGR